MIEVPIVLSGPAPNAANVAAFMAQGNVTANGTQVVPLQGESLALHRRIMGLLGALSATVSAEERQYPTLIPVSVLERTDYFHSFPHQATFTCAIKPESLHDFAAIAREGAVGERLPGHARPAEHVLSPAVCYHCYAELAETECPREMRVFSATGRCFRREDAAECRPLARQREFSMHEIIFMGTAGAVIEAREQMLHRVVQLAKVLGLRGRVVPAHDPFFGTLEGRARSVHQEASQLKLELVIDCGDCDLAIASFNGHEDYFGRAFEIRAPGGGPVHTACVAFGIERWLRAVVAARGTSTKVWDDIFAECEQELR
jgi:seryl-tRNA synthetase